ncbi:hypothetical protein WKW77_10050 [Variovorax ureilyticus]|uniref:Uncharacterized protein n=1 Tax=Variovorax ureilyticus TaxID=1836198 RepID=A0ABU8VCL7_9BURK
MSSLDLEHDEPDEYLPPVAPAPAQHLETPWQRLERMLRTQAALRTRHSLTMDADDRERLRRLIAERDAGIAYQRGVAERVAK